MMKNETTSIKTGPDSPNIFKELINSQDGVSRWKKASKQKQPVKIGTRKTAKMPFMKHSSVGLAGFRRKVSETIAGRVDLDSCDPETCVSLLNFPTMKTLSAVNKKIKNNNNDEWMQGFLDARGLDELLDIVEDMGRRRVSQLSDALSLLECVSCIKSVLNSKLGLEYLVQHEDYTRKLAMGL